jgi:hypothetical protein
MIRQRQRLGKYRIGARLAVGGFGDVYEARDTIEGCGSAQGALAAPAHARRAGGIPKREVRLTRASTIRTSSPIKSATSSATCS